MYDASPCRVTAASVSSYAVPGATQTPGAAVPNPSRVSSERSSWRFSRSSLGYREHHDQPTLGDRGPGARPDAGVALGEHGEGRLRQGVAGLAVLPRGHEHAALLQPRDRRAGGRRVDVEVGHQGDQRTHRQRSSPRRARTARTASGSGGAASGQASGPVSTGSADPGSTATAGVSEPEPLELAGGGAGELGHELDRAGVLVRRDLGLHEVLQLAGRDLAAPAAGTTYAFTSMPRASSGTPMTAHSATAACLSSASSTSGAAML